MIGPGAPDTIAEIPKGLNQPQGMTDAIEEMGRNGIGSGLMGADTMGSAQEDYCL